METKSTWRILLWIVLTVVAFAQDRPRVCRSTLQVAPGISTVMDCGAQTEGYMYEWACRDSSWLTYLRDAGVVSPRFNASVDEETPSQLAYDQLAFDAEGELVEIPCTGLHPSEELLTYRVEDLAMRTVKGETG